MSYGDEDKNTVLKLTYNYGVKEYDKGNGYAQVCKRSKNIFITKIINLIFLV